MTQPDISYKTYIHTISVSDVYIQSVYMSQMRVLPARLRAAAAYNASHRTFQARMYYALGNAIWCGFGHAPVQPAQKSGSATYETYINVIIISYSGEPSVIF